ncbi:MAG: helix-turn-helix transcriptional regulator [Ruminococcaceae bacterium]|nr:helix-turn-helix transcriptional regulator [Oscillospiraceae bacterium]
MNMKKKLYVRLLHEKEEGHMHVNYNDEYNYYQIVANGDIFSVKKILINPENINIYNKSEYGQLSRNNLRNIRYHFIVAVALITRACVERGLNREFAYTLSDLYIERMDSLNTPQQILSLYNDMLINFCQEMMEIKKGGYSLPVVKIIEFVEDHINENISIEMIADSLRYNRCYLSTVFKKETGTTIKEFICDEKIKATVDLLRFSNYTCLEISELFHFASQSYYIKCFKNKFGCTPNEYRKQYLRK